MKITIVGLDTACLLFSGAVALSQIALNPWRTVAGAVVGAVASLFMHFGFDALPGHNGNRTKGLHLLSSIYFGILRPAGAKFSLLKSPFLNGFNAGVAALNLALAVYVRNEEQNNQQPTEKS